MTDKELIKLDIRNFALRIGNNEVKWDSNISGLDTYEEFLDIMLDEYKSRREQLKSLKRRYLKAKSDD